jgi:hypothetical protein
MLPFFNQIKASESTVFEILCFLFNSYAFFVALHNYLDLMVNFLLRNFELEQHQHHDPKDGIEILLKYMENGIF